MLLLPNALGPHSIFPLINPTIFPDFIKDATSSSVHFFLEIVESSYFSWSSNFIPKLNTSTFDLGGSPKNSWPKDKPQSFGLGGTNTGLLAISDSFWFINTFNAHPPDTHIGYLYKLSISSTCLKNSFSKMLCTVAAKSYSSDSFFDVHSKILFFREGTLS